ncbi:MAG TPA: hypothetical protein VFV78_10880 [Vicinamibacterales bacterium]|nr:hypothetical protein [Vicinamibacterales bacterium]
MAGVLVSAGLFSMPAASGSGPDQIKPATGPGAVPTKGPCRTYDTSVTAVTTGGGMTVTLESSGVFDPWSLRMVQNVRYSSTGGGRFQYVQTSTWDSAEDFIAEVIRLKPPAPLPSTPGASAVNDIIPPLTRSRGTVATGQIGLVTRNSFGADNKWSGFDTRASGALMSMRYTAWDSTGRPTAGSMKGPQGTSTVTITYDDNALSKTETMTTAGITSVMTTTYDRSGNPRTMHSTVTGGASSTTVWTPHSQATLCLLDLRAAPAPPTTPFGPNPSGTFTASIGGQSFTASMGLKAESTPPIVSAGAGDGRYLVSIAASAKPGPGTYTAGPPPDTTDWVRMTEQQFRDLMDHNTVVATVWDTQTKRGWQAAPTIGTGTVNLTSISGAMVGTFDLTLEPIPGTGASGSLKFNGSFNVKY